jgi:E3 ubiquitin-protein ligase HUWE1
MDVEQHAKVLAFACGSARLPAAGFTAMQPPFTVTVHEGEPTNHLPSAHTCMNNLCFPLYESKEELQRLLLQVIDLSAGFGFL